MRASESAVKGDEPGDLGAAGETGAPLKGGAAVQSDDLAGVGYAAFAYIFWGIVPIYWRWLASVPPFEITVHRVLWCAFFVVAVTLARGRGPHLLALLRNRRLLGTLTFTSVLISANWLIYIYCVSSNQLVEASLGYYIVPLLSIALGVAFYGERLSRLRAVAVGLAGIAVVLKALDLGHIPWIATGLALSFGFYGYFRKRANVDAMDGLTVETLILFPITLALVLYWSLAGTGAFATTTLSTDALLVFGGPLTAVPLAAFAAGARRIRLSTLGFLQYLAPSITLTLAIFGFGERFTRLDAATFGLVWLALVIVAVDSRIVQKTKTV